MSIIALNNDEDCNILVQLKLFENEKDIVEHSVSDEHYEGSKGELDERLFRCIIVSNSRFLTFRP